jgi:hypothetical protein
MLSAMDGDGRVPVSTTTPIAGMPTSPPANSSPERPRHPPMNVPSRGAGRVVSRITSLRKTAVRRLGVRAGAFSGGGRHVVHKTQVRAAPREGWQVRWGGADHGEQVVRFRRDARVAGHREALQVRGLAGDALGGPPEPALRRMPEQPGRPVGAGNGREGAWCCLSATRSSPGLPGIDRSP